MDGEESFSISPPRLCFPKSKLEEMVNNNYFGFSSWFEFWVGVNLCGNIQFL